MKQRSLGVSTWSFASYRAGDWWLLLGCLAKVPKVLGPRTAHQSAHQHQA